MDLIEKMFKELKYSIKILSMPSGYGSKHYFECFDP